MSKARTPKPPKVYQETYLPLDAIREDPQNARSHPAENLADIRASLLEYGQVEPLIVRRGKGVLTVIGGNGRLQVMRELGWAECLVKEFEGSDAQARGLGIILNRSGEKAGWIDLVLGEHLRWLQSEDFNLAAVGFDDAEADRLIAGLARDAAQDGGDTADGTGTGDADGDPDDDADGGTDGGAAPRLYPLAILLTRAQLKTWQDYKAAAGISDDTEAFLEAVEL